MLKFWSFLFFLCLFGACSKEASVPCRHPITHVLLVSDAVSSRASAYIDSNKIIETEESVYFVYLDSDFNVAIQKFDKKTQLLSEPFLIGNTYDNHGNPTIQIDDNGYIYVMYGGHANEIFLATTIAPYDISNWKKETITIDNMILTYPVFMVISDKLFLLLRTQEGGGKGDVLFFMSKDINSVEWKRKALFCGNHDKWVKNHEILYRMDGYNRFYANMSYSNGRIHISFQNLEYVPQRYSNVDEGGLNSCCVGYIYSDDFGDTWKNFTGRELVKYPAIPSDLDLVNGYPEPVDDKPQYFTSNLNIFDHSPVLMYHEMTKNTSELVISRLEGGKWNKHYIDYKLLLKDFYVVQETSCSIDKTGNLYVLLTVVDKEDFFHTSHWGTPSSRLMYMVCDPQYNILKLEPVISEDHELTWLPNLGKSNQENQFFIFMQGNNSSDNLEKVRNKLWFGWIGWE